MSDFTEYLRRVYAQRDEHERALDREILRRKLEIERQILWGQPPRDAPAEPADDGVIEVAGRVVAGDDPPAIGSGSR